MKERITWKDLFTTGSLVSLQISQWTGITKLKPADLGLENTEEIKTALSSLGYERLVRKETIDPIRKTEMDSRRIVASLSIPFPLISGAFFIPQENREELEKKLAEQQENFYEMVTEFCENYDENLEEIKPILYQAILQITKKEKIAAKAINRISNKAPSIMEIADKFLFDWNLFSIDVPRDEKVGEEADLVLDMVKQMSASLRQEVMDKVKNLIEITKKQTKRGYRKKISERSSQSAKDLIEKIRKLNVFGDKTLNFVLAELERAVLYYVNDNRTAFENTLLTVKSAIEDTSKEAIEDIKSNLAGIGERDFG